MCTYPVSYTHLDVYKRQDKYGHARGDELIIEAALHMRRVFPQADIYRIGGDEFVIISTNPVSYTHLDVYKRQHVHAVTVLRFVWLTHCQILFRLLLFLHEIPR